MRTLTPFLFLMLSLSNIKAVNDNPAFLPLPKGLTNNTVTSIIQDKQGFIWMGTFTGLNKFDGYSYEAFEYNLLKSNTISNSRINDLQLDPDGNILIGTYGGGLNIFNKTTRKLSCIYIGDGPEDLQSNNIRKILVSKGFLILAATDNGLYQIRNDSSYLIPLNGIDQQLVTSITETTDGEIWVGTQQNGLYKLTVGSKDVVKSENIEIPGKSKNIRTLMGDYKGNLWISYFENGFSQLKIEKGNVVKIVHSSDVYQDIDKLPVQTIFCNINGEVWLGTENYGLAIVEPGSQSFTHYMYDENAENSLPDNSIWSIYRDISGVMWLGTYSHGAYRIDPFWNKFDQYLSINNFLNSKLKSSAVTSFYTADKNSIILTSDGMKTYQYNNKDQSIQQIKSSGNNALHVSKFNNEYWISTWNNGIQVFYENWKFKKNILPEHSLFKVIETQDKMKWAASWGDGVFVLDESDKIVEHFTSNAGENRIISSNIFTVYEDNDSRVWIGTLNGLSLITKTANGYTIENFISEAEDSTTLSSNIILSIYEDSDENIWIGTSNGLNKYIPNENSFKRIIKIHHSTSYEIRSILEGTNHNLWLGTSKGLIRFNIYSEKTRIYDESDGLPFLEFRNNSANKIDNDQLIFGGNGGVIIFDPTRIEDNPKPPNTIITDIKIFNNTIGIGEKPTPEKSISSMQEIELSHDMNVFTLGFTAINYTRPEKNTYSYMLEGLENDWNYVGSQRNATYSNLDPGEYTFKVRSANNDGIMDDTPAVLKIIVTPPFYKTWWFRVVGLIVIALIIYLIVRIRMNELNRRMIFNENLARLEKWKRFQMEMEKGQQELDVELDDKTQRLAEVSLQIAHKNEKLFTVHQQILDILPNASRENYKKLVQLRRSLEEDINQKENWKALETGINLSHDNFLQRFTEKYPKITHKDLKLVAYIRMNMSNKEIASLLNITLRSVESGRYRLRKRLNINKDVNLNDFIIRF